MQTNIFSLIDELVSMNGNMEDYEKLNSELIIINEEILGLKSEIDDLSSSMTNDRYFDAAEEIVDRNIELSVSKKLAKLEKEYDDFQDKENTLNKDYQQLEKDINEINKKINKTKEITAIIEDRINIAEEKNTKDAYNELLKVKNEKIKYLNDKLSQNKTNLNKLSNEIEQNHKIIEEIKNNLEKSTSRLLEVRKNLSDKNNYFDKRLKTKDNKLLSELKGKLAVSESKKTNIESNINYLANEIKELFINDQTEQAMKKLSEMIKLLNKKPYMEINDIAALEEELEKLEKEQSNLINLIENKNYNSYENKVLDYRIKYVEEQIEVKKESIATIKREIENIDSDLIFKITNKLEEAENEGDVLEKAIDDYFLLIKKNDKSPNTLISLQNTVNKKKSELNIVNSIINKYTKEISALIKKSSELENESIKLIENEILEYENELEELKKLSLLNYKAKDAIEQEKDKDELKLISDNINILKHRIKYPKTPQEIYDQIEMLISSDENSNNSHLNSEISLDYKVKPSENLNNISEIETGEKTNNDNNTSVPNILETTFFDEINNLENEEQNSINLQLQNDNTNNEKESNEEEYTFSELADTDYFSLEEFLKKLETEKNE